MSVFLTRHCQGKHWTMLVFSAFLIRAINTPPANKIGGAFCESNSPTQKEAVVQGGMEEVKTESSGIFSALLTS